MTRIHAPRQVDVGRFNTAVAREEEAAEGEDHRRPHLRRHATLRHLKDGTDPARPGWTSAAPPILA